MSDGRRKETQLGLGNPGLAVRREQATPPEPLSVASSETGSVAQPAVQAVGAEHAVRHVQVISPTHGTPVVRVVSDRPKPASAQSAGAAAAAAYVEPITPPPVRKQRSDTVAVLLAADIDPQKVPTEPSLSRRREASAWSDISLLPPVKYREANVSLWRWALVAAFGGAVGYWVYWGATQGGASPMGSSPGAGTQVGIAGASVPAVLATTHSAERTDPGLVTVGALPQKGAQGAQGAQAQGAQVPGLGAPPNSAAASVPQPIGGAAPSPAARVDSTQPASSTSDKASMREQKSLPAKSPVKAPPAKGTAAPARAAGPNGVEPWLQ